MTTYRVSQHKIFTINSLSLLFLADESAIFQIDPETSDTLDQLSGNGDLYEQEVLSRLTVPDVEKQAFFEELLDQKFLMTGTDGEKENKQHQTGHAMLPLKTLVLQVTDTCNLGCIYCYHSHVTHEKGTVKKKGPMSAEVARQSVDFLYENSGGLDEVCLVFFGGEPFLNFDLISDTVPYALEKAEQTGKKIVFTVTTNGTLLSEEVIRFLYDHQIGITVSIDGMEGVQNRNRPFPGGGASYGVIRRNIRNLFRIYGSVPVPARVTVASSPEHIPETLHHLLDLGFSEVGFAPATTTDTASQLNGQNMDRMLEQFRMMAEQFLASALKGRTLGFSNLIDLLTVLHEGEVKNYPCGAGLGLFSADPKGDLYLCQRLTSEESCFMGDVFAGFSRSRVDHFREGASVSSKEICAACWARNLCAGGCYHEALVREGDLMSPNHHYCQWIKRWVAIGIKVYGQLADACPEYMDTLLSLRAS